MQLLRIKPHNTPGDIPNTSNTAVNIFHKSPVLLQFTSQMLPHQKSDSSRATSNSGCLDEAIHDEAMGRATSYMRVFSPKGSQCGPPTLSEQLLSLTFPCMDGCQAEITRGDAAGDRPSQSDKGSTPPSVLAVLAHGGQGYGMISRPSINQF